MNKRNYKIIRLYAISLLCIVSYFFLENSNLIPNLVEKLETGRYGDFPAFFLTGLFKNGLLCLGIGLFLIVSFILIKEKVSQKRYKDKHGNEIIEKGDETYIIPAKYEKTGASYKIFLRNETDKIVTIKNKFTLRPNEENIFTFVDTDSILFDIGPEIYFGEYGLETNDIKGQLAGIGGEYWETYKVPEDVEYGFVIVSPGSGDM